jgi:tRNA(Arg) A34 adenosine deaminase TadA
MRPEPEGRMRLAVELAAAAVANGGGPFGAAVFERRSGRLVAPGVNLVLPARLSLAHAEIVALACAEQRLGTHDLGEADGDGLELVTSAEPCVQCFGAALWSGVGAVTCGARTEDAEAAGFDEGPKPGDWAGELTRRGVRVTRDVLRREAAEVIRGYAEAGGPIYNPGSGD